jgi:2-polyprenyl-3-methyl-5-hydroxy-6-metoxy-1,4-benzoquinol methylase
MNEYEQLKVRNFGLYSPMHQAIYKTIAELLRDKPANILEVGTGIGYGLQLLLSANCIKTYTGIEPNKDCCDYVNTIIKDDKIVIINESILDIGLEKYDFTLLIEVIEHMTKEDVIATLKKLNQLTINTMFMSTPKKETDEHGVFTEKEIRTMLRLTHWNFVEIEWQLPHTLYICQHENLFV